MANNTSVSLDKWRDYFRSANSDIFCIIEHAIMVAASDCPYDFKTNRDRIAEMLFTCKMTKCLGCDRIGLAVPSGGGGGDGSEKCEDKYKSGVEAGGSKDTKESKAMNSCSRENDDDDDDDDNGDRRDAMEMNVNQVCNFSFDDAEALTDEIEEESVFYLEVLRIKGIVDNYEDESDTVLFDSLRRLQLMPLSVETLKESEIGKSVNALRKHGSKEIRNLARTLIEDWKVMVDSWVEATAAIAGSVNATECVKTSAVEEEEGLPSPPMDEGAFFTNPMELSQFFDGMDDDGNLQNSGEFNKNRESGRKPNLDKTDARNRKIESRDDSRLLPPKDKKVEEKKTPEAVLKRQTPPTKPNRPPTSESGPGRPKPPSSESGPGRPKPAIKPPLNDESKVQQRFNKGTIQKKPMPAQQQKFDVNNEASVTMKLEVAKRKLQERYQEAEKAKKQRTIQVVELRDIPKQGLARNQHMRGANHNRNWANGRR